MTTRLTTHRLVRPAVLLIGAGLAFRLVLAFVAFPGQGFAGDIGLFQEWATTLARVGPGAFYATATSADYPPGYLYVLWLIGSLGAPVAGLLGGTADHAVLVLMKLPAVLADVAIGVLLYRAATRWFGGRAGLWAAGLYLFLPVTWYDSALWGQVDAVGALVMLAALILLVEGWSEPAVALAALAVLVKPQDAVIFVVVVPVLLRRHLLRLGPVPRMGRLAAGLDRRLDGLFTRRGPIRLATSAMCASVVAIVPLIPFDIVRFAPPSLADVPVIGHVAGLIGLFVSVGDRYAVLTANAYNGWSLVGPQPLASVINGSSSAWTDDSILVLGLPAVVLGGLLLAGVALVVAAGLLSRDDRTAILLGFAVIAFAFYELPTRVHERYLFPVFAVGALLAASHIGRAVGYVGVGLVNTVNLHAVLAGTTGIGGSGGPGGRVGPGGTGGSVAPLGPGSGIGGGRGVGGFASRGIDLPWGDLARSEPVVIAVALGQLLAFVTLLGVFLVVCFRPRVTLRAAVLAAPGPAAPDPA